MNNFKRWLFIIAPILILSLAAGAVLAKSNHPRALKKSLTLDHQLIDVNQIAGWLSNDGILMSDPVTGQAGLYFPKGSPSDHTVVYTAGLWVVGKIDGEIRSAAADYATEFQPGMILENGAPDDPANPRYKIFKFKAEDWDSPDFAADRAEAISQGMEDKMYGDQMLYCVYNDWADHSGVWTKPPMGLEVRQLAFGYNRVGALGNTIFIKYTFINKGTKPIKEAYVSQFFDPDNGGAGDDGVACDTTLGVGYVYNMDGDDEVYGAAVPSFGCDFFQGPVVPSPGDTAFIPGQPPLVDHKMLQMTSFGPYINGGPPGMSDPSLQTAQGAQMAYWFCSGLKGDGTPWKDPTQGDKIVQFPFAGDPVTGTGWIQSITWPGADMRMSLAAGPFDLEVGVPYTVVVGYIVGLGKDNLNSIEVMKSYDKSAQIAYDLNFNIAKPAPYPNVTVGQMDRVISLSWDNSSVNYSAENKVDLDPNGNPSFYNFEGFKLYQGESEGGPWTLIKQWDKDNDVGKIWDYVYDPVSGENIYSVVENGKDIGLAFSFLIDKDYLNNVPLVNGKPYYFSLTTYSYDEWGSPRVLENAIKVIKAIPQKPVLNTKLSSAPGDSLDVTHTGPSDGLAQAIVVDPLAVTGHDYKVTFSIDDHGNTVWKVSDVSTGQDKISGQTHQAAAATLATDSEFPVVDGVLIKISGPPPGVKTGDMFANENDPKVWGWDIPSGTRRFTWAGGADAFEFEGFRGALGWAQPATYFGSGYNYPAHLLKKVLLKLATADTSGNFDPNDPNVSYGYRYGRGFAGDPKKPEFAPFIVNPAGGYSYQDFTKSVPLSAWDVTNPDNPRRLVVGFLENNADGGMVDGKYWPPAHDRADNVAGGGPREWLFIFDADYGETPNPAFQVELIGMDGPIMYWATWARRGNAEFSPGASGEDQFAIFPNMPNAEADIFSFSTKGYEKVSSAAVAKARLEEINVFPNPYFASNTAETDFFTQFITFSNLPEKDAVIRIFSLSGQLVRTLKHENGTPFDTWDLKNEHGLPVSSGMFIALIDIPGVGQKILKIAIINREARYRHM